MMLVAHTGNPAMRCWADGGPEKNVVDRLVDEAVRAGCEAAELRLFIAAAVSAKYYRHHDENARDDREWFLEEDGESVFHGDSLISSL